MLTRDYQTLEPGSLVTLIEVDCTSFGGDVLYFHGHNIAYSQEDIISFRNVLWAGSLRWAVGDDTIYLGASGAEGLTAKSIWWKGIEYKAWPCEIEGLATDGSGRNPTPTLSVGNVDGTISALCLYFDDLLQAKVTVRNTLSKYLDSKNFTTTNPDADPSQEGIEIWYIDSKTAEDNETISWELSSPADVSGMIIPARVITAMCEWCMRGEYRGPDCNYTGSAMFTVDDEPTDNPELDQCGGTLRSCKVRFGETNELSFGGFPSANLLAR